MDIHVPLRQVIKDTEHDMPYIEAPEVLTGRVWPGNRGDVQISIERKECAQQRARSWAVVIRWIAQFKGERDFGTILFTLPLSPHGASWASEHETFEVVYLGPVSRWPGAIGGWLELLATTPSGNQGSDPWVIWLTSAHVGSQFGEGGTEPSSFTLMLDKELSDGYITPKVFPDLAVLERVREERRRQITV